MMIIIRSSSNEYILSIADLRRVLRMQEAHLLKIKTLEEFDFTQLPHIPAARIRALAEGGYFERAEPVLLVGDPRHRQESSCHRPGHRRP
jgi:DNA replication protein DnaC